MDDLSSLATRLDHSRLNIQAIPRLTLSHPDLTLDDAYRIQQAGIALREKRGETVVGYKMGLTSQAKQQQMHVSTPIFGVLTNAMRVENKQTILLSHYIQPKAEPEIAFILGKDLQGEVTAQEALAACDGLCAAIDLIDSRYIDFKFTLIDVVADNTSAGSFVLGPMQKPTGLDLANLSMDVIENKVLIEQGHSSAILGNPINSLIMLTRLLTEQGALLKAGSIVLSGAATDAKNLQPTLHFINRVESLGDVSLHCIS